MVTDRRGRFGTRDSLLKVSEILYDNINNDPDCY